MNTDVALSLLRNLFTIAVAYAAGKGWLTPTDATSLTSFATTVGPVLIPAVVSLYSHWGMVKAPDTAITAAAISRQTAPCLAMLAAALALFAPGSVRAADLKLLPKAVAATPAPIDLSSWTGFYVGAGMTGLNQGTDILSGGLAGLNAGGTVVDLHGGAMTVNKSYLLGGEFGGGYRAVTTATDPKSRWSCYVDAKAGGSLSGVFGSVQAPQNGGPFNLGTAFANMMPYVHTGSTCGSSAQSFSGVGVFVPLQRRMFLTGQYDYGAPMNGAQQFQAVRFGINWAF